MRLEALAAPSRSRDMRIGLITPGFSASEEDWCVPALLDLVRVLAESDEVEVFALRYPHRRRAYAVHGATVHPTGGAQRGGVARLPILLGTLVRVLGEARRRPFDALQALWAHEPGFVAAVAGRLTATPVVVSLLGGELAKLPEIGYGGETSRANRWLTSRALAGADRVTVGSETLRRLAARRVPREKLRLQPLGVDLERFRPGPPGERPEARQSTSPGSSRGGSVACGRCSNSLPPPPPPQLKHVALRPRPPSPTPRPDAEVPAGLLAGDPKLLQVASLSPVKGQRVLLRAFAAVAERHRGARLHLVGDGELRREIGEVARDLGLAERVDFHGAVSHGRLVDYYRQADLLVVSSLFEAQGMTLLEAAACGCPVVGTAVGVLPELGPAEALATPGDIGSLARVVERALTDPRYRERLAATQAAAVGRFELRASVERLRRRLAALAASRREELRRKASG